MERPFRGEFERAAAAFATFRFATKFAEECRLLIFRQWSDRWTL